MAFMQVTTAHFAQALPNEYSNPGAASSRRRNTTGTFDYFNGSSTDIASSALDNTTGIAFPARPKVPNPIANSVPGVQQQRMPAIGRGGAGNIEAERQLERRIEEENKRVGEDLEAQRGKAEDEAASLDEKIGNAAYAQGERPIYTGRGGAGNFATAKPPTEIPSHRPKSPSSAKSPPTSPGHKRWPSEDHAAGLFGADYIEGVQNGSGEGKGLRGRGGAGNYTYAYTESGEKKALEEGKEKDKRRSLNQKVRGDVETALRPPERVALADPQGRRVRGELEFS